MPSKGRSPTVPEPQTRTPDLRHWRHADKLAWIREQLARGELVVRQATDEERRRYGIRAGAAPRPPNEG